MRKWREQRIIGLLIVKDEADILRKMLKEASKWMYGIVALDNGSTDATKKILRKHPLVLKVITDKKEFNEARMVRKLHKAAAKYRADWYVDIDADEFFDPFLRSACWNAQKSKTNIITVDIHSYIGGRCYNIKYDWRRIYRNKKSLFDYSVLKKLHHGKIPIAPKDRRIKSSKLKVYHFSIRSYKQGLRKYNNYLKIDKDKIQKSYEHIKKMALTYRTGDYTGIEWVN